MAEYDSGPLESCERCPRLVALRREIRAARPDYHAAPVAAWGPGSARLLVVGLAPGMHGANRTGRPFTGDSSGDFLFRALNRAGFSSSAQAADATLTGVRITNAVKCLPPENRPVADEINRCASYLREELAALYGRQPRRARVILCLGGLAHNAVLKTLTSSSGEQGAAFHLSRSRLPAFAHGRHTELARNLYLLDTYHPSRLNTNTGRLTEAMLNDVMATVRRLLGH